MMGASRQRILGSLVLSFAMVEGNLMKKSPLAGRSMPRAADRSCMTKRWSGLPPLLCVGSLSEGSGITTHRWRLNALIKSKYV